MNVVSVLSAFTNVCENLSRFAGSSRLDCSSKPVTGRVDGKASTDRGVGCSDAASTGFAASIGNICRNDGGRTAVDRGGTTAGTFPEPNRCAGADFSPFPDITACGTGGSDAAADCTGAAGPNPANGTASATPIATNFATRDRRRRAREDSLDMGMRKIPLGVDDLKQNPGVPRPHQRGPAP
ncbi:hypothetical protein AB0H36_28880 [Kribbella sp. NPDC050820]|uniref:hypothetical protein n=1 Tax=Kribbella sp. NPDC050820 TaxID=3155408 RepID=UPI003406370D